MEEGATLEVRWIRRGALTAPMVEWFGALGEDDETREDVYLVGESIRGLSVKIRGGAQLDLKVAQGTRGILDVEGRAEGEIESWQKWAFPLPSALAGDIASPGWVTVRKIRHIRRFSHADVVPAERALDGIDAPWCAVELTDVSVDDEPWWTLGFEATGPAEALQGTIDAAAALVFGDRIPDTEELTAADSTSYTDWLRTRLPGGARHG
ncbi:MAG: hypothetical protein WB297_12730 [Actinomycetota bacterium]